MPGALGHPFFLHAVVAGTVIAVSAGLVGYFLVLRGQIFAADALSHVAFTGALAALALGADARVGLFAATLVVALLMAGLARRGHADDVVIGNVFSWVLGLGVLALTIYTTTRSSTDGRAGVSVLFGTIFGLSGSRVAITAGIACVIIAGVLLIGRPLLFATFDPAVAAARGVPVRLLSVLFLGLTGVTVAEATQAVGALLLLGLLAAPAGTAIQLTSRPWPALAASAGIATVEMWVGLGLSYAVPVLPPSFAILAAATTVYLATWSGIQLTRRRT